MGHSGFARATLESGDAGIGRQPISVAFGLGSSHRLAKLHSPPPATSRCVPLPQGFPRLPVPVSFSSRYSLLLVAIIFFVLAAV